MNIQDIGNDICVFLVRKTKSVTQSDICAVFVVWRQLGRIFRVGLRKPDGFFRQSFSKVRGSKKGMEDGGWKRDVGCWMLGVGCFLTGSGQR